MTKLKYEDYSPRERDTLDRIFNAILLLRERYSAPFLTDPNILKSRTFVYQCYNHNKNTFIEICGILLNPYFYLNGMQILTAETVYLEYMKTGARAISNFKLELDRSKFSLSKLDKPKFSVPDTECHEQEIFLFLIPGNGTQHFSIISQKWNCFENNVFNIDSTGIMEMSKFIYEKTLAEKTTIYKKVFTNFLESNFSIFPYKKLVERIGFE